MEFNEISKYKLCEIKVNYKNPIHPEKRFKIRNSNDAYQAFLSIWKYPIDHREVSYAIFMNSSNQILGYNLLSVGGKNHTVVDISILLQTALKINANSIMIAHNHTSGISNPSNEDKQLTRKLVKGCELVGINFIEHLIIYNEGYTSFCDEGMM